ncbi:MAG: hypothetical protein ACRENT_01135, partial [Thermodesulfobacteriota bacterium]
MRRIYKISIGLIFTVIILLVITVLWFLFYLNPFTADGPFTGEPGENCNLLESPVQVFPINSGYRLEVYARKENYTAPTVLLRDRDNN